MGFGGFWWVLMGVISFCIIFRWCDGKIFWENNGIRNIFGYTVIMWRVEGDTTDVIDMQV